MAHPVPGERAGLREIATLGPEGFSYPTFGARPDLLPSRKVVE
jgi:hypothetical protein